MPSALDNLELAAVGDHDGLRGLARLRANGLDRLHHVEAIDDAAEDDVLAIKPANIQHEGHSCIVADVPFAACTDLRAGTIQ